MSKPKLSKEAKAARGTLRPCRERKGDPYFPNLDKMPTPPADMATPGKELWKTLGPRLVESRVMTIVDIPAFEILCYSHARAVQLESGLTKDGKRTFTEAIADPKNAALFRAYKHEREVVRRFMGEFGVTPAARNRVAPVKTKAEDPDIAKMRGLLGM